MRRIAVISTNDKRDYLFYLPVVVEGWYKLGYDVLCFYCGKTEPLELSTDVIIELSNKYNHDFDLVLFTDTCGIDEVSFIQTSRLFGGYVYRGQDVRLITSDIDMLVVKDIFDDKGQLDVYGHDLTGYQQVPMCYVSATAQRWYDIMGIDEHQSIEQNIAMKIRNEPFYTGEGWQRWSVDQEILTKRLKSSGFYYDHAREIEPGSYLPKGRLDRSGWRMPNELIDVHLPRNPLTEFGKLVHLAGEWFPEYFNKFKEYYKV